MTRRFGGTGLGLTISSRLVTMLGGSLSVHSTERVGSEFLVRLPAALAVDRRPRNGVAGAPRLCRRGDPEPRGSARGREPAGRGDVPCARRRGQPGQPAHRPADAAQAQAVGDAGRRRPAGGRRVPSGRFDLVLMDVQMPEMNGFEAVAAIRALEQAQGRPHTPIVAVTAHAMVGDRERCLEAGMDAYLAKPLRRQLLFELVDELLGSAAAPAGAPPRTELSARRRAGTRPNGRVALRDFPRHAGRMPHSTAVRLARRWPRRRLADGSATSRLRCRGDRARRWTPAAGYERSRPQTVAGQSHGVRHASVGDDRARLELGLSLAGVETALDVEAACGASAPGAVSEPSHPAGAPAHSAWSGTPPDTMSEHAWLADRFEAHRGRLTGGGLAHAGVDRRRRGRRPGRLAARRRAPAPTASTTWAAG